MQGESSQVQPDPIAFGRPQRRIRTLVVEDEWLLRHATSMLLKHEPDIQVVGAAQDGAAALDKVNALQPDMVVTDIAMPDMGGLELAFLLRRRFPSMGIVVVGTVHEPEIRDLCGLCGADILMDKALLSAKLPAVIRTVYAVRRSVEERRGRMAAAANFEERPEEVAYSVNPGQPLTTPQS